MWFNGKMYGVHKFNNVSSLNTDSTAEQVLSALNVSKSSELYDLAHRGVLFIDTTSGNTIVKYEDGDGTFQLYVPSSDSRSIKKLTITVSSNKVTGLTTISHLMVDDIRNTLTSTETNKALSAAMGKKLQDEKLSKTDVVNNLTTTDTTKALSAAQGEVLNSRFKYNYIFINFSAINNTSGSATIKKYMGNADGNVLVTKLTSGAALIDSSSEDWVITPQEVSATKVSFTGIRFAGFNLYSKNISVTISGSNYTNMTVAQGSRFVPAINNTLTSTSTSEALSAAQGKALNDKISALGSVYRIKGSKTNISEVLALTDAKVGDAWNVTNAFTFGGKPYPANTNVVCITATSTSDHDENNWDPIGGTVDLSPYAKKSDISYTTDLPDSLVVPQTIGGINKGTKVSDLEGSTISQMFDNLLFPEVQPTIQAPSATIHFKDTFSSNGVYEVGTTAPIAANFNTSFNRGTCTVVGQADKNRAGNLDSGNSFIYYGGNTSTKTLPAKVTLGTMQYNYHAAYAQGDTLVTSKGNKASVTPNPLPAGSVNSSNLTIFGTYPYYCNGQSASSSSGDSNFPTSATPDTKLP